MGSGSAFLANVDPFLVGRLDREDLGAGEDSTSSSSSPESFSGPPSFTDESLPLLLLLRDLEGEAGVLSDSTVGLEDWREAEPLEADCCGEPGPRRILDDMTLVSLLRLRFVLIPLN